MGLAGLLATSASLTAPLLLRTRRQTSASQRARWRTQDRKTDLNSAPVLVNAGALRRRGLFGGPDRELPAPGLRVPILERRSVVGEPTKELHCPPRAGRVRHLLPAFQCLEEPARRLNLFGTGRMEPPYLPLPVTVEEHLREPGASERSSIALRRPPEVRLMRRLTPARAHLDFCLHRTPPCRESLNRRIRATDPKIDATRLPRKPWFRAPLWGRCPAVRAWPPWTAEPRRCRRRVRAGDCRRTPH